MLARGPQVLAAVDKANDYARIALSAQLLGCARRAFDTTLEYLKVRVQFGKPIGSFQSLQHRMVDSYIQLQMLEFALWEITATPGQAPAALAMQASRLKARAEQAAGQVTRLAVQMHGGMGYSDESDVGLMLKKAIALSSELGNRRAHLRRYLKTLQQQPTDTAGHADVSEKPGHRFLPTAIGTRCLKPSSGRCCALFIGPTIQSIYGIAAAACTGTRSVTGTASWRARSGSRLRGPSNTAAWHCLRKK